MNLIKDEWIPALRADGTRCKIAPWEIGYSNNPVIEISAPRPDFRGALYQFLIGLVQTAYAPDDEDEWEEKWNNIPSCDELKNAFMKYADAFELVNENGPAFMQDYSITEDKLLPIEDIIGGVISDNTRKKNRDLFNKRDRISSISPYWAALGLFNIQISGVPQWGQHRVGLRLTGPITTILMQDDEKSFFHTIYANILPKEDLSEIPGDLKKKKNSDIFPWMGVIRYSPNKEITSPVDGHPLQHYWPLPKRIKLNIQNTNTTCDLDGEKIPFSVRSYQREVDGVYYSAGWIHPLSPYLKRNNNFPSPLSGEKLKNGYRFWLCITSGVGDYQAAKVVEKYNTERFLKFKARVWAFGYESDSANLQAWHENVMPIIALDNRQKEIFIKYVQSILEASETLAEKIEENIVFAWNAKWDAKKNKYVKEKLSGDTSFISASFWSETETKFYSIINGLFIAINNNQDISSILKEWLSIITKTAKNIFDRYALQNTDGSVNMERIAIASKSLDYILNSPKTTSLQVLREGK